MASVRSCVSLQEAPNLHRPLARKCSQVGIVAKDWRDAEDLQQLSISAC